MRAGDVPKTSIKGNASQHLPLVRGAPGGAQSEPKPRGAWPWSSRSREGTKSCVRLGHPSASHTHLHAHGGGSHVGTSLSRPIWVRITPAPARCLQLVMGSSTPRGCSSFSHSCHCKSPVAARRRGLGGSRLWGDVRLGADGRILPRGLELGLSSAWLHRLQPPSRPLP